MFFIFQIAFFQPPASSGRKSLTPRAFNKPLPFSLALSQHSKCSLSKRCRCLPPLQMAPPDTQGNSSFAYRWKWLHSNQTMTGLPNKRSGWGLRGTTSKSMSPILADQQKNWAEKFLATPPWQLASFGNFSDSTVFQIKMEEPLQCKPNRSEGNP